jgi:tripartite-type tricarboxylate transporter receptor subunit TctC
VRDRSRAKKAAAADTAAIADVAAGQVPITFVGVASASALYKAGRVKVLGVASAKRSSTMPDVPTLTEAGYKLEVSQWFALFARAGTPKPIIDQLNAAAKIVLEKPDVREAIIKQGAEPEYATPQQLDTFFRAEIKRFGDIIRQLDIKVN